MICKEGADEEDEPEDAGVAIEAVELLCKLRNISFGCAMLFWTDLHTQPELCPRT